MMILAICLASMAFGTISDEEADKRRIEEERVWQQTFEEIALLYHLREGEELKEITSDLLSFPHTKPAVRERIVQTGRRFFLFSYPCDGLKIKGYISFVPNPEGNPLLYLLRGGTEIFGIMNPANRYSVMKNYTVISSSHRGGVSEGRDQYGGDDVNDIAALIDFFPALEEKLETSFQPRSTFILGGSRGGMDLFLALARYPDLQKGIDKVISLSGLLDMEENFRARPDLVQMFTAENYGLILGVNEQAWIDRRNPILTVPSLRNNLPILIIQGTADNRAPPSAGVHMLQQLQQTGRLVEYWEIENGDHCINNREDIIGLMADWLEQP